LSSFKLVFAADATEEASEAAASHHNKPHDIEDKDEESR